MKRPTAVAFGEAERSASERVSEGATLADTVEVMRQIVGSLPNDVVLLNRDLRVLFVNRPSAVLTPATLKPAQLHGLHITEILPAHLHPLAVSTFHRVLASGNSDGFAAELAANDGLLRHFDMRISPVWEHGQVLALTLVASETTERIRAERAIATQARMIESMLEGVAVVNERGVIEITNPAFDAMFGFERGALIGRELATLAGRSLDQLAAAADGSMKVEFDARRRDGSYFSVAGVLSGIEVAGGNHRLAVLQDVSERKQLERAILQAVNREQYRIGNDLHDGLGQELTGIALMLRGVAGRLTNEFPAALPEIEGITRLVSNAIENTRALARGLSPVNLERGGLQDALEGLAMHAIELYGVEATFSHRAPSGRLLNAEIANHLYRIAQEAVSNAVRHGKARTIRLHLSIVRAKVRLTITDDGIGMPEAALDAAGMGLKTMRYRARMLGGEVQFERLTPNGTRIVCECLAELPVPAARPTRRRLKAAR
jgi:PAS domain S-box-containing protein